MKEKVLFVDDEKSILSSVKRLLHKEPYSVHVANSGQEGLEFLKDNQDVSVIISDMRMPQMDGVAFLKEAHKLCPDAVTAILSGYADSDAIMTAVNEGDVWRYLRKPWEDNELKICIKNAIEMYVSERQRRELLVSLEEKVKERTWQLQTKNELLDMIIEDAPINDFLSQALKFITKKTRAKAGQIQACFQEIEISEGEISDLSALDTLRKKSSENKTAVNNENFVSIPLIKSDEVLGVLTLELAKEIETDLVIKAINGYNSTIVLALSQHKTLNDAPDLMKNVDKLIDGLA